MGKSEKNALATKQKKPTLFRITHINEKGTTCQPRPPASLREALWRAQHLQSQAQEETEHKVNKYANRCRKEENHKDQEKKSVLFQ